MQEVFANIPRTSAAPDWQHAESPAFGIESWVPTAATAIGAGVGAGVAALARNGIRGKL
jgi:hypothetical protein